MKTELIKADYPYVSDLGDGTYRNPILYADYSDPDVIRVGDDYYMIASSFTCTPGLPILHSRDLVNWTLISHAVRNLPHPRFTDVQPGCGVWAPAIRYHAGRFWIVFPMPDEGLYVTTADKVTGPWSEPHLLLAGKGLIDPCPLWDDDGQAYVVHAYAKSRAGIKNKIHVRPMAPDASRVLDEGNIVFELPPDQPAFEGPKFLKRNGWYYISAPGGGVPKGWQAILRSRNVYGPYEQKIVLAQRGTPVNGPHQGALVESPSGEWWFLHFQDAGVYGRIVHLQPVRWENDWPLIGIDQDENGVGKPVLCYRKPAVAGPVPVAVPQTSDEFDEPLLGLQWQWQANHDPGWCSLKARPGFLRLFPQWVPGMDFAKAPALLLQKFPAREFAVTTQLDMPKDQPSVRVGLIVMGRDYAALEARRLPEGYCVRLLKGGEAMDEHLYDSDVIRLGVVVNDGGACRFGVLGKQDNFYQLGPAFAAREGVWVGAKVGLFCATPDPLVQTNEYVDVEYFRFDRVE